jgi:hypothetical protein
MCHVQHGTWAVCVCVCVRVCVCVCGVQLFSVEVGTATSPHTPGAPTHHLYELPFGTCFRAGPPLRFAVWHVFQGRDSSIRLLAEDSVHST